MQQTDLELQSLINSLETLRTSQDHWLFFWTALVVIGVALELAVVIYGFRHEWYEWRLGMVLSPAKPSWTLFLLELLGALFVAVGVAGELSIEARTGRTEAQIKVASDNRATLLQQEAGSAKSSAIQAAQAAKSAKETADDAKNLTEQAKHELTGLSKQADTLDNQMQFSTYSQSARRVLHPDLLAKQLSPYKGQNVDLVSYIHDIEAEGLCRELVAITEAAGMHPTNGCATAPLDSTPILDISLKWNDMDQLLIISSALRQQLAPNPSTVSMSDPSITVLNIFVGVQPRVSVSFRPSKPTK